MGKTIKKISAVILSAVMILMFTGCAMIVDITTSINKNGSGTMTLTFGLDEELWSMVSEGEDSMDDMEEIDYNGQTIHGMSESYSFDSYDDLNKIMNTGNLVQEAVSELGETTEGADDSRLFVSFEASRKGITAVIDSEGLGLGDDIESMKEAGVMFKFPLNFTFEDEVVEANGKISEDKHTVTYDLLTDKEINIKLKNQNLLPIIIAVIAVIALVIFFVSKSKKKKAVTEETPVEEVPGESEAVTGGEVKEEAHVAETETAAAPAEVTAEEIAGPVEEVNIAEVPTEEKQMTEEEILNTVAERYSAGTYSLWEASRLTGKTEEEFRNYMDTVHGSAKDEAEE